MPRLELKDWGGAIAIMLSLLGLVWNAAGQVARNEQQDKTIASLVDVQTRDHDRLGRIEAAVFPNLPPESRK